MTWGGGGGGGAPPVVVPGSPGAGGGGLPPPAGGEAAAQRAPARRMSAMALRMAARLAFSTLGFAVRAPFRAAARRWRAVATVAAASGHRAAGTSSRKRLSRAARGEGFAAVVAAVVIA